LSSLGALSFCHFPSPRAYWSFFLFVYLLVQVSLVASSPFLVRLRPVANHSRLSPVFLPPCSFVFTVLHAFSFFLPPFTAAQPFPLFQAGCLSVSMPRTPDPAPSILLCRLPDLPESFCGKKPSLRRLHGISPNHPSLAGFLTCASPCWSRHCSNEIPSACAGVARACRRSLKCPFFFRLLRGAAVLSVPPSLEP